MALPAGPRTSPLLNTIAVMRDPFAFFARQRAVYGEVFSTRGGDQGSVYVADPEGIAQVFAAPRDVLHGGEGNQRLRPFVGETSVLTTDGEPHRTARKALSPPFQGARMRAWEPTIAEVTERRTAGLSGEFAALPVLQQIALEVIVRLVYGTPEAKVDEHVRAINHTLDAMTAWLFFFPFLLRDLGPWSPGGRYKRRAAYSDSLLYAEVARRRQEADPDDHSVLGRLLRVAPGHEPLPDVVLRDQLVSLLAAGHESTAIAIAWALYFVWSEPGLRERLDDDALLDSICTEVLRIRPPVSAVQRIVRGPFTLLGHELPIGTRIVVSIAGAHTNPALWPDPDRFIADRHVGAPPSPNNFLPFGGGSRRCLGEAMARLEMKVVLRTLSRNDGLQCLEPARPGLTRRGLFLAPRGGVRMRA